VVVAVATSLSVMFLSLPDGRRSKGWKSLVVVYGWSSHGDVLGLLPASGPGSQSRALRAEKASWARRGVEACKRQGSWP